MFHFEEQYDRNQIAKTIGKTPSPRCNSWLLYLEHRLRMMENGIETYTTRNYARLQLDKHIEWHRGIDKMAGQLVRHKPSIVYVGAGKSAPNSPIRIKKHVRCPGTRKLCQSLKNRNNCVIRMVDEFNTSQHCGKCFKKYPAGTKSYRYKKCANCRPNPIVGLPRLIVTNLGKRILRMRRTIEKEWRAMWNAGNQVLATLIQPFTRRLVSQKTRFLKTWQPNANVDDEMDTHTTVWHRDISAAKLILYRGRYKQRIFCHLHNFKFVAFIITGHCELHGLEIHPALRRQNNNNAARNQNVGNP